MPEFTRAQQCQVPNCTDTACVYWERVIVLPGETTSDDGYRCYEDAPYDDFMRAPEVLHSRQVDLISRKTFDIYNPLGEALPDSWADDENEEIQDEC